MGLDAVISRLAQAAPSHSATSTQTEVTEAAVRQLVGPEHANDVQPAVGPPYWRNIARIGLKAAKAYQQAIAIFEELSRRSPSANARQLEIAGIQNELGRMHQFQRQFSEARQCHLAALRILGSGSADSSSSMEAWYEPARIYYLLGTRERPLPDSNPVGPRPVEPQRRGRRPGRESPPPEDAPPAAPACCCPPRAVGVLLNVAARSKPGELPVTDYLSET